MLTPTGATVSQYWMAIKNGNPTHVRLTYNGGVTLDDSDVNISGIEINDILNGDIGICFGKAVMKEFKTQIFDSSKLKTFSWNGEFQLEFGVEIGTPAVTNWVTVGYFTGVRPENYPVNGLVDFVAYDRMGKFDISADDFLSGITYPITFGDMYHDLCTYVGVSYDNGDELANIMGRSFSSAPIDVTGLSCRDVLALIAEACGCYAKIGANGHVRMTWYSDQTTYSVPADEEFSLSAMNLGNEMIWNVADTYTWNAFEAFTWDDLAGYKEAFHIDSLVVNSSDDDIGVTVPAEGKYTYYIIDNPFLYNDDDQDVQDYIEPIYNRLNTFGGYLPMTVECTGNWLVETGDILTVDFHGESVELPVFSRTMHWKGSCRDTYEATGSFDKDYLTSSTHDKLTQMGRFHEVKRDIEQNYERIQDQFGNYYTKIETATYISLQLTDYYGHVSGITIDNNGVDIVGNKYVRIAAETNRKWVYDENGLSYINISENDPFFQLGAVTSGSTIYGRTGVFYDKSGDPNYGQLLFTASRKDGSSWKYSYFRLESYKEDGSAYISLVSSQAVNGTIGKKTAPLTAVYSYFLLGNEVTTNDGDIVISPCPSSPAKGMKISYFSNNDTIWVNAPTYHVSSVIYSGTLQSMSSRDIKHDIVSISDTGDIIDNLRPVSFVYDTDPTEKTHYGLIYEEAVDVLPEICVEMNTQEDISKQINYVELIPILLKEIQDLRARVKALEESEVD